jgi:hypothetical protein
MLFLETGRPPFVFCFLLMANPTRFLFLLASQKRYIQNKQC